MATTGTVALKRQRMSGTMDALHDHPAPEAGMKWQNEKSRPEGRLFNNDQGSVITPSPQVCEVRKAGAAYHARLMTTTSVRARPRPHGKAHPTRRYESTPSHAGRTLRRPRRNARRRGGGGRMLMLESTGRWESERLWTPRDIYRARPRPGPTRPLRGVPSLTYGPNQGVRDE